MIVLSFSVLDDKISHKTAHNLWSNFDGQDWRLNLYLASCFWVWIFPIWLILGLLVQQDQFDRSLPTFIQLLELSDQEKQEYQEVMLMVEEGKDVEQNSGSGHNDNKPVPDDSSAEVSTVTRLNNKVKTYTHNNGTSWVDVCVYVCVCANFWSCEITLWWQWKYMPSLSSSSTWCWECLKGCGTGEVAAVNAPVGAGAAAWSSSRWISDYLQSRSP